MSNYPTVNYIGNKEKISDWIVDNLPIKDGVVLDLFCGGCSVSYALKQKGYSVISNDALYSNFVLAKAIIENSRTLLSIDNFKNILPSKDEIEKLSNELSFLKNKVYFDYEVDELAKLILISYSLKSYKKYMFLALLRRAMIRKIPYSRMNIKWEEIQKFRDEEYSYKKYGRYRHYHNIPFIEHIKLNLEEYNDSLICNDSKCKAMQKDALDCVKTIKEKVDLIYIDPPYPSTMNKYDEFYGYFDSMFNKNIEFKVDLTDKKTFLDNFYQIIKAAKNKTKYLAISLNNKCYPDVEILIDKIKELICDYSIKTTEHVYKVTGKENKHTNYEILLICKMKEN